MVNQGWTLPSDRFTVIDEHTYFLDLLTPLPLSTGGGREVLPL